MYKEYHKGYKPEMYVCMEHLDDAWGMEQCNSFLRRRETSEVFSAVNYIIFQKHLPDFPKLVFASTDKSLEEAYFSLASLKDRILTDIYETLPRTK